MNKGVRFRILSGWLILLMGLMICLGGCTKQRAQMALNKAKKVLAEAERQEAEKYKPDMLEETRKALSEADSQMSQRQFPRALERAKQAVDLAKKTVEEAKIKRAADKLNQAKRAIDVANTNDGSKEDPERFKKIMEYYDQAQAKRNKDKWDEVIRLSDLVIHEVEILLQRLKNLAERKLSEAQDYLKSLRAEDAETYSPESIIEVTDLVNKVEKLIKENQDYISAQNTADYAIRKAEEGIIRTKGRKSQERIKKIESDLALAISKGAEIYARENLEKVNSTFEAMVKDYFTKNYDRVLMSAPLLESDVQQLLETTKRRAAEARIKAVVQTIRELTDGGAKEYLPGRVEVLETKLAEAQQKFEAGQYEEAESVCLLALDEGERIRADFNDLALDAMRNATEALNIAQDLLEQMDKIFIVKTLPTMSPLEQEFENNKEALKRELTTMVQNARVTLSISKLRQEGGQFKRAIELAGEVRKSAEYILNETYHVVAHNAIMELAQKISDYERDGGREYAPAELDKTKKLLEEAKAILQAGRYKEAASKAGETRAQMEIMVQTISQTAMEHIKTAKEQLAEANKYQVEKYKAADLKRAEELLAEAETQLRAQQLRPAVEKSFAAATLLKSALNESARLWAEEELATAEEKISRAEQAEADEYAKDILDEARSLREAAKRLMAEQNFLDAKNMAERAGKRADDALFKKLTLAEDLIAEAKAYGGWEYEFELLSRAVDSVQKSRDLIERRDFISSRLYAEKAIKEAQAALNRSKEATHHEQVNRLKNNLQKASTIGVNYFQSEQAKEIAAKLAKLETEFTLENFDYSRKELEKLEADLNHLMENVPGALDNIVKAELARIDKIAEDYSTIQPGKTEEAQQLLKYAQIDFKKGKNTTAYQQLKQADQLITRMETTLAEDKYIGEVEALLTELEGVMGEFNILTMSPEAVLKVARDVQGKSRMLAIANKLSPTDFKKKLEEINEKAIRITPPTTKQTLHREVLGLFNTAVLAGIDFEKLSVLEEYNEKDVNRIVKRAFGLIDEVKKKKGEIRKYLSQQKSKIRATNTAFSL